MDGGNGDHDDAEDWLHELLIYNREALLTVALCGKSSIQVNGFSYDTTTA